MSADPPSHDDHEKVMPMSDDSRTITRRRLIKALIASGLAAAGSTLPSSWLSPAVEMGVLPAHAQVSATPTAVPPTPTPTPTPIPYAIVSCAAGVIDGEGSVVFPWDTMWGYCSISPADPGIDLRQTITLIQPGFANQVLRIEPGLSDASGTFTASDFDLDPLNLNPVRGSTISVLWEFVDPAVGTGTCENILDFENPQ